MTVIVTKSDNCSERGYSAGQTKSTSAVAFKEYHPNINNNPNKHRVRPRLIKSAPAGGVRRIHKDIHSGQNFTLSAQRPDDKTEVRIFQFKQEDNSAYTDFKPSKPQDLKSYKDTKITDSGSVYHYVNTNTNQKHNFPIVQDKAYVLPLSEQQGSCLQVEGVQAYSPDLSINSYSRSSSASSCRSYSGANSPVTGEKHLHSPPLPIIAFEDNQDEKENTLQITSNMTSTYPQKYSSSMSFNSPRLYEKQVSCTFPTVYWTY